MRLLFERLVEPQKIIADDHESQLQEIKQSIKDEILRITSGQSYFSGLKNKENKSLLNYGLGDLISRAATQSEYIEVAQQLEQNIKQFETRLTNIKVDVIPLKTSSKYYLMLKGDCVGFHLPNTYEFSMPLGMTTRDTD